MIHTKHAPSNRLEEIVQLLAGCSKTTRQIADQLMIDFSTAGKHVRKAHERRVIRISGWEGQCAMFTTGDGPDEPYKRVKRSGADILKRRERIEQEKARALEAQARIAARAGKKATWHDAIYLAEAA